MRGEAHVLGIGDRGLVDSNRIVVESGGDSRNRRRRRQRRDAEQQGSGAEFDQRHAATLGTVLVEVHGKCRVEVIVRPPLQLAANAAGTIVVDSISAGEIVDVAAPVAEGAAETEGEGVGYRTGDAQRTALLVVAGRLDVAEVAEIVGGCPRRDIYQTVA